VQTEAFKIGKGERLFANGARIYQKLVDIKTIRRKGGKRAS
jgi:hypothetical protein